MTTRRFVAVVLVAMYVGAASLVVELMMSWPPDLPWELVRYVLVALYVIALTVVAVAFVQGRRNTGGR